MKKNESIDKKDKAKSNNTPASLMKA